MYLAFSTVVFSRTALTYQRIQYWKPCMARFVAILTRINDNTRLKDKFVTNVSIGRVGINYFRDRG